MIVNKRVTFCIERTTHKTDLYITESELNELLKELTPNEISLYAYCKFAPKKRLHPKHFKNTILAKKLGISVNTLQKYKSVLKTKGFLIIQHYKDIDKQDAVRILVGKRIVFLYSLGLVVDILDKHNYIDLVKKFNIEDPELNDEERLALVDELNNYYLENHKQK